MWKTKYETEKEWKEKYRFLFRLFFGRLLHADEIVCLLFCWAVRVGVCIRVRACLFIVPFSLSFCGSPLRRRAANACCILSTWSTFFFFLINTIHECGNTGSCIQIDWICVCSHFVQWNFKTIHEPRLPRRRKHAKTKVILFLSFSWSSQWGLHYCRQSQCSIFRDD